MEYLYLVREDGKLKRIFDIFDDAVQWAAGAPGYVKSTVEEHSFNPDTGETKYIETMHTRLPQGDERFVVCTHEVNGKFYCDFKTLKGAREYIEWLAGCPGSHRRDIEIYDRIENRAIEVIKHKEA